MQSKSTCRNTVRSSVLVALRCFYLRISRKKIKTLFPVSYQDHREFMDYQGKEDGSKTAVIKIKGVKLKHLCDLAASLMVSTVLP
ncbi:hypothetical protein GCM10008014_21880 [Paenibacillus silvae]|uniref:Uncharacterized protein n=1 Tax=Paenibacillus silvae TaxID=1325358 RepID=A0ABQ1Z8K6_9BACL|nr:hypothetical protein GCM10008014_21880 [Paenibacillus silvae]